MHRALRAFALVCLAAAPAFASAQDARIGRLPVLAPLRTAVAQCRPLSIDARLRAQGVTSGAVVIDSALGRTVTLTFAASGRPIMLIARMSDSTGARRREMEMVTASFDTAGRVLVGKRMAMTGGTPARRGEDRRSSLLPSDTTQLAALASSLRGCVRR